MGLDELRSCSYCHGTSAVKHCSGCRTSFYCGTTCQKKDWPDHKQHCKILQAGMQKKDAKDCVTEKGAKDCGNKKGAKDCVNEKGAKDCGNEVGNEFSGEKVEAAVKQYLRYREYEVAEQLCVQVIRAQGSEKSLKSAKMFLLLAEVISGKSDQPGISLIEGNNKILQAKALCYYVINLCKLHPSSAHFSKTKREATLMINNLQKAMFLSIGVDVSKGRKAFKATKRAELEEIRSRLRADLESLPNLTHSDLDNEFEYYQKIQELYKRVAEHMRKLLCEMLEDCSRLLGPPPCDFAAIALGSLARLEATPYSDLEWALLIEKQDEDCKLYFRNLTQLLHLMVLNFGETILPSMGIKCLDSWFYDDVTPRGLAFDAALPQACKTPLGKRKDGGKIVYELIGTPEEISQFQRLKWVKVNQQLAGVLRTVLVINQSEKSEKLTQEYKQYVCQELDQMVAHQGEDESKGRKLRESVALLELDRDFHVFNPRLGQEDQAGKFFDVKKEIYRLMDRLLASVALYFNAEGQSAWDCLQWLRNKELLSEKGMRNLFVAASIGAEMRARAYTEEGRQNDYLDCSAFLNACNKGLDTAVSMLGVSSVQTLFRYYFTVLPFFFHMLLCASDVSHTGLNEMEEEEFYCDSSKYRALVNMRFRQYQKAKVELQRHLLAYPEDGEAACDLGNVLKILQKFPEATTWHSRALHSLLCDGDYEWNGKKLRSLDEITCWQDFVQPFKSSMNTTYAFYCLRIYLYNLGMCYGNMEQDEKAIDCLECCVELHRDLVARESSRTSLAVQGLAQSLNVLGHMCNRCEDEKDVVYLQESMTLYAISGSHSTLSAEATAKFNLAACYYRRGEFEAAQTLLKLALDQYSHAYGKSSGSYIAHTQFLSGKVHLNLQRYSEAVEILTHCMTLVAEPFWYGTPITQSDVEPYLKVAVVGAEMLRERDNFSTSTLASLTEILVDCHEKESLVVVVLQLAEFCLRLQQPLWAFNLSTKCLSALREVYGETSRINYTFNLGILGRSCSSLGKRKMAEDYLTWALRNHYDVCKLPGKRSTSEERTVEIGLLLALGNLYKAEGSYFQALEQYHKCFEVQRTVPNDTTAVVTLSNLGNTYCMIGRLEKGIEFHQMAFKRAQEIIERGEYQPVVNCKFLSEITNSLCTTLMLCNQKEKIPEIKEKLSRLMALLSKK